MDETVYKVIQLLIEVGLSPVIAEELSDKIEELYKAQAKAQASAWARKGGKTKGVKGFAYMKINNPEKFEKILENNKKRVA